MRRALTYAAGWEERPMPAKLTSAHAVQKCLYEVLLYADGENAVVYAEAAHVVATLMEDAVDKLDPIQLRRVMKAEELGESGEQPGGSR